MLFMGEVTGEEAALPLPAMRRYLLCGEAAANLGFLYANPIGDERPLGVLTLCRNLGAGPLNHDQPALVRALVLLLSENLANAPVV
jgi:hypothetical protein